MAHGGKREGAGRPATKQSSGNLNVRLGAEQQATLAPYPKTRAVELLASGLRLGAGNVGDLSETETVILRAAVTGSYIDALTLRHLADEVADVEHPDAPALAARMCNWGDWELLHVLLTLGV